MMIYILTFITILLSKSLYYETFGQNYLFIPYLFLLSGLCFFLRKKEGDQLISKNYSKAPFYFLVYAIFIVFLSEKAQLSSTLVFMCSALIAFFFTRIVSFEEFAKAYIQIVVILAYLSLLTIVVFYFNIKSPFGYFNSIDVRPIRNFIIFGIDENFIKYSSYRNAGLWWEPGAFQVFLSTALLFGTVLRTLKPSQLVILSLTILSTKSTTGALVLMFALLMYLGGINSVFSRVLKLGSLGFLALFLVLNPEMLDKFKPGANSYDSFLARVSDFNISLWLMKYFPLWGYGFGNLDFLRAMYDQYAQSIQGPFLTSGTDGMSMFMSQVGIFGVFLFIVLLNPKFIKDQSFYRRVLYGMAILCIFNTQNFMNFPIFHIFLFYSFGASVSLDVSRKTEEEVFQ